MITLDVKTKVDTTESESSVDRLTKSIDKLTKVQEQTLKEQSKLNDEVAKSSEETKKSLDSSTKATKGLAGGFKGVGLAIKAAGIGLLIGVFQTLKTLFQENQEVADFFSTAMKGLQIAFNDFVNLITDNAQPVIDFFKAIFDDPLGSIKELGNAIKDNIIERFNSALEVVGYLSSAFKKVFEGDFAGALEDAKNAGKEYIDVLTGVDDTFDKTVEVVTKAAKATSEYVKETYNSAEALVEQEKAMARSETTSRMLQLSYQKQAEEQRQIRDDETKTFQQRIEANEELARILKEAAEVEKAEVQKRIDNLQKEQKLLGYKQETEDEIYALKVEQLDIEERLGGIKSEQLTNQNSLIREQKSLANELSLIGKGEVEKAKEEALQEREQRLLDAELAIEDEQVKKDALLAIEQEYQNKLLAIDAEAKEKSNAAQKASDDEDLADAKKKESMKKQLLSDGFKIAGELSSKNAKAQKGIAATEATINTLTAITGTLAGLSKSAAPGVAIAQAVATGVFGMLQVQKILSTNVDSGSTPSVSGPSGSGVTSASPEANQDSDIPNFDFINQGVGGNAGARLNRSYVVNQDIKDQNQLAEKVEDISVTA